MGFHSHPYSVAQPPVSDQFEKVSVVIPNVLDALVPVVLGHVADLNPRTRAACLNLLERMCQLPPSCSSIVLASIVKPLPHSTIPRVLKARIDTIDRVVSCVNFNQQPITTKDAKKLTFMVVCWRLEQLVEQLMKT